MGTITGALGLNGGQSGTGVAGPASANFLQPVSQDQLMEAYTGNVGGMAGARGALDSQQKLLEALQAQGGIQNQNQVFGQLQGIASGAGPNPAQLQYQQNVNEIAAQQSGALASQKGLSPALRARLIAQQGGMAKQQAAGQGAANLANQQLGAISAAGNLANTQVANQIGATNANTQGNLAYQQNLLGAMQGFNNNLGGMQGNLNSANAGLAGGVMQNQATAIGGALNAAGGGMQKKAHGGFIENGPRSMAGQHFNNFKAGGVVPGKAKVAGDSLKNDTVDAKLSPGEIVLPRTVVNSKDPSGAAARFVAALMAKKGKRV